MKSTRSLAVVLGSALVAASLLATGAPASAQSLSFSNPLATSPTVDIDITSLDVDYSATTVTITAHVQNVPADFTFTAIASALPKYSSTSGGSIVGFGGDITGGVTTKQAISQSGAGSSTVTTPLPTDSVTLTRNDAAGTISASIGTATLGPIAQLYVGGQVASGSDYRIALKSFYSAPPAGELEFFGPVLQGVPSTTTTIAFSSPTQSYANNPALVTATVTPANAAGSVQFYDGATLLGTVALTAAGTAAYFLPPTLATGAHSIHATFVPATAHGYLTSSSAAAPFTVVSSALATTPKVTLSKKSQVYKKKSPAKVTVKLSPSAAPGTITFYDGKKKLKTVTLKSGKASYTLSKTLKKGTHKIKAVYTPTNLEAYATSSKTVTFKVKSK